MFHASRNYQGEVVVVTGLYLLLSNKKSQGAPNNCHTKLEPPVKLPKSGPVPIHTELVGLKRTQITHFERTAECQDENMGCLITH